MELFDSHAHVDGPQFDGDRAEVLARARAAGVTRMITVGTGRTLEEIGRAAAMAEREPDVWATAGVHPHDAALVTESWWPVLEELCRRPRVVAVGETGLDYHYDHSPRERQLEIFRAQVELARAVDKPVVCHVRDAHEDTLAVLSAGGVPGVIHCFTGGPADARAYAALGLCVSFSGIVTFKTAEAIREAVKEVPLGQILIETDCPYLAPVPLRGKRNEPSFLVHTAEVVARAAGVPVEELAAASSANASRLFRLT